MRQSTSAVLRSVIALSAVTVPSVASAQVAQWVQTPAGGCATSIAVAPNGVPWVTGCDANADHEIYYLGDNPNCGNSIYCPPRWIDDNGRATSITVDNQGGVYAANSSGELWEASFHPGQNSLFVPSGGWSELSPKSTDGIWPSPVGGGCVTETAAAFNLAPLETFDLPFKVYSGDEKIGFYALGCDSQVDHSVYMIHPPSPTNWVQLDAVNSAAASQIAVFNFSTPSIPVSQTLWAINSQGGVFAYNGVRFIEQPQPPRPALVPPPPPHTGSVYAITDHFVASFNMRWENHRVVPDPTSGIYQWNDETSSWEYFVSLYTPDGHRIMKIAHSGVFYVNGRAFGPSLLWGIDEVGNIYSVGQWQGPPV